MGFTPLQTAGDKAAAVAAGEYWDEVLVAIGGLGGSGATDLLADANITAVFFEQEALAQGDTGTAVVIYNELSRWRYNRRPCNYCQHYHHCRYICCKLCKRKWN